MSVSSIPHAENTAAWMGIITRGMCNSSASSSHRVESGPKGSVLRISREGVSSFTARAIETIRMSQIEGAYERMLTNDVKYRFGIAMATMAETAAG